MILYVVEYHLVLYPGSRVLLTISPQNITTLSSPASPVRCPQQQRFRSACTPPLRSTRCARMRCTSCTSRTKSGFSAGLLVRKAWDSQPVADGHGDMIRRLWSCYLTALHTKHCLIVDQLGCRNNTKGYRGYEDCSQLSDYSPRDCARTPHVVSDPSPRVLVQSAALRPLPRGSQRETCCRYCK